MRLRLRRFALAAALAFGLSDFGAAIGGEPSEAQMKEAMLYAMNHPPGGNRRRSNHDQLFQKGGSRQSEPERYNCSFDVKVASANIGASSYNNIPSACLYQDKDSGKWAMRLPF